MGGLLGGHWPPQTRRQAGNQPKPAVVGQMLGRFPGGCFDSTMMRAISSCSGSLVLNCRTSRLPASSRVSSGCTDSNSEYQSAASHVRVDAKMLRHCMSGHWWPSKIGASVSWSMNLSNQRRTPESKPLSGTAPEKSSTVMFFPDGLFADG
jgi:hypothetical protein